MSKKTSRPILITSALPYANGSIHIGHLVEYIQSDIYARFLRLMGEDVIYLCADDTHGTPIQLKSTQLGVAPEELVKMYGLEHQRDFAAFQISFDYYYSTHSKENKKHVYHIFHSLKEQGHIYTDEVDQYFCQFDNMFLPDRFIKGICPKPSCRAPDQYGDSCEICGLHYRTLELISPYCAICGGSPILKKSRHYFVRLSNFTESLKHWTNEKNRLQKEIKEFLKEWFKTGLKDWDISRDAPYFGFLVPGETDKFFYVWLDAPVGYISTTDKFCAVTGRDFDSYWHSPEAQIYHFIGKDIIYFHTLFWPAMLMSGGYASPARIFVHGFLKVNGNKMSKTKGTFISAKTYRDYLDPQYLRYYYASKLSCSIEDLDLNLHDFVEKVNADLINRFVNLVARTASLSLKYFEGQVGEMSEEGDEVFSRISSKFILIEQSYQDLDFANVTRLIMEIVDTINKYINENVPWKVVNEFPEKAHQTCSLALHTVRFLTVTIKPIVPKLSADIEAFLDLPPQGWGDAERRFPKDHRVRPFSHLLERITSDMVESVVEASKKESSAQ